MTPERFQHLIRQYFNDTISKSDCIELLDYINTTEDFEISDLIDHHALDLEIGPEITNLQAKQIFDRIAADSRFTTDSEKSIEIEPEDLKRIKLYQNQWFQIAAVILVFCAVGLYFLKNQNPSLQGQITAEKKGVTMPATDRSIATLTLANGEIISLGAVQNGELSKSRSTSIQKINNGQLVYSSLEKNTATTRPGAEPAYHTLSTPKGGEYQLVLPDGTHVWLNSFSSLSFPAAFSGKERHVKLNGEAYFEVAKNKDKPFYVTVNDVTVKVLGTHFNISAYRDDKDITTTLLEGSVQVAKNNKQTLIKPGQQAIVGSTSDVIAVSEAKIKEVMAWKNGYFIFNDEDIFSIMKQVSRWYNVEVEYNGNFDDQRFGGTFYRSKSINELLHHLEKIGKIHFKIAEGRITVME